MANFFHKTSKVSTLSSIELSSRGTNTTLGAFSVIDDFVKIKHVGGTGHIIIGDKVYLNSGTVLYSGNGIQIGNNVLIGPNCSLTPVNHEFINKNTLIMEQGFKKSKNGIIIEDDVWIGANVTILDGAIIRQGAVIGANSLVNHEVDAFSISYGSPCSIVGHRK